MLQVNIEAVVAGIRTCVKKLVLVCDWLDGKGDTFAQLTMSMISLCCTSRKLATTVEMEHP